jgi:hypothetical protein
MKTSFMHHTAIQYRLLEISFNADDSLDRIHIRVQTYEDVLYTSYNRHIDSTWLAMSKSCGAEQKYLKFSNLG